jgi:hypothetical protein
MVRSYVFTGKPLFKQQYLQILAIRDGKLPRPPDYQNIYWDLMRTDTAPATGERIALLELMRRAGFTQIEFAKLAQAKANSDTLTRIEFAAMRLIETSGEKIEQRRLQALTLLHDTAYHDAKAGIMQPISEFQRMMEARANAAVSHAIEVAYLLRIAFILFGVVLVYLLWRNYAALRATLGGSVDELQHAHRTPWQRRVRHTHSGRTGHGKQCARLAVGHPKQPCPHRRGTASGRTAQPASGPALRRLEPMQPGHRALPQRGTNCFPRSAATQ